MVKPLLVGFFMGAAVGLFAGGVTAALAGENDRAALMMFASGVSCVGAMLMEAAFGKR